MSDLRHLSHTGDPDTSNTAALKLDAEGRQSLKEAIITLLDEKPMTADELAHAYSARAELKQWPLIRKIDSVTKRRAELVHTHKVVRDSGKRRLSDGGIASVVWELTLPADEARLIVAMRGAA